MPAVWSGPKSVKMSLPDLTRVSNQTDGGWDALWVMQSLKEKNTWNKTDFFKLPITGPAMLRSVMWNWWSSLQIISWNCAKSSNMLTKFHLKQLICQCICKTNISELTELRYLILSVVGEQNVCHYIFAIVKLHVDS